jgi:uncharacterized protein YecT (DUF1311 family)
MEQILLGAGLGMLISLGGYLTKRWWEGQSVRENIQDFVGLAKLRKDLTDADISLSTLQELKKQISDRNISRAKGEAEVIKNIEESFVSDSQKFRIEDTLRSQSEMNRYAFHLTDLAERELEFLLHALRGQLDEEEERRFQKAQRAWRLYSRRQADFSAGMFEGGSMRPMVYSSELRALTIERAAKIKDEIRERRALNAE